MGRRTVSERLADHVHDLAHEDLPAEVVARAKDLLVHHLGVAFRADGDLLAHQVGEIARYLGGSAAECVLIGESGRTSMLDAVFGNAMLMGFGGLDDFILPSGVHPGVATLPAALAVGEREHVSGREMITAVVAGYDLVAKLADTVLSYELSPPRQAYSLFAAFGSAAVAARLLRLTHEQTAHAIAYAAHLGVGLVEAGDDMDQLEALVARNGAIGAALARAGMPMALTSIEGEHGLFRNYAGRVPETLEASLATLGRSFDILRASPKRYGGSALNIGPQELTAALLRADDLTADDVAAVVVTLPRERERREALMETRLMTGSGSPAWSARFLVASVVACGEVDPQRYVAKRDDRFERVLDKVRLRYEADRPMRYARVEITTTASTRHVAEGDDHVFPPVDWYSWLAEGGRRGHSEEQLRRLVGLVESLEEVGDVAELTACLAAPTDLDRRRRAQDAGTRGS